jgi:hypothetical protein
VEQGRRRRGQHVLQVWQGRTLRKLMHQRRRMGRGTKQLLLQMWPGWTLFEQLSQCRRRRRRRRRKQWEFFWKNVGEGSIFLNSKIRWLAGSRKIFQRGNSREGMGWTRCHGTNSGQGPDRRTDRWNSGSWCINFIVVCRCACQGNGSLWEASVVHSQVCHVWRAVRGRRQREYLRCMLELCIV